MYYHIFAILAFFFSLVTIGFMEFNNLWIVNYVSTTLFAFDFHHLWYLFRFFLLFLWMFMLFVIWFDILCFFYFLFIMLFYSSLFIFFIFLLLLYSLFMFLLSLLTFFYLYTLLPMININIFFYHFITSVT